MMRFFSFILSKTLLLAIILNIFLANPLFAQSETGARSSAAPIVAQISPLAPVDFSASLISMVKGLAICIALLLGAVWVLKKLKSPLVTGQGRSLRIIERLPVSAKSSILLIEVNKKKVLIGVGSDQVSLISDFVDSDALEVPLNEPEGSDKND